MLKVGGHAITVEKVMTAKIQIIMAKTERGRGNDLTIMRNPRMKINNRDPSLLGVMCKMRGKIWYGKI